MTIEEKFEEVKNHPMAILLLDYYTKSPLNRIPTIWQTFIQKSTKTTNLDLLHLQLPTWDIKASEIPPTLYGPELLTHLLTLSFRPLLKQIEEDLPSNDDNFISTMEQVFKRNKLIPPTFPHPDKVCIQTNLDCTYVEKGIIHYAITRTKPSQVIISSKFIQKHFRSDQTDTTIWNNFLKGLKTQFKTDTDSIEERNDLLKRIEQQLPKSTPSNKIPPVLPYSYGEFIPPGAMTFSNPIPQTIESSSVYFSFPKTKSNRIKMLQIFFSEALQGLSSRCMYEDSIGGYITDPSYSQNIRKYQFFTKILREIYDKIKDESIFRQKRKLALETPLPNNPEKS